MVLTAETLPLTGPLGYTAAIGDAAGCLSSPHDRSDRGQTDGGLADCLVPRLQRRQVRYDLAHWGNGGAMLALWFENSK
jgi:hypothetical protein